MRKRFFSNTSAQWKSWNLGLTELTFLEHRKKPATFQFEISLLFESSVFYCGLYSKGKNRPAFSRQCVSLQPPKLRQLLVFNGIHNRYLVLGEEQKLSGKVKYFSSLRLYSS